MKNITSVFTILIYFILFIGYCRCVYKFISCDFDPKTSYKAEVIYGIGTLTGAGSVIGWFDLGK